jgi:hypothetical protein
MIFRTLLSRALAALLASAVAVTPLSAAVPPTSAEADSAVPAAGTPNRALTNAFLKDVITTMALRNGVTHTHEAWVNHQGTGLLTNPASTSVGLVGTIASTAGLFNTNYGPARGVLTASDAVVNSGLATVRGQANTGALSPGAVDTYRLVWEGFFYPTDTNAGRRSCSGMAAAGAPPAAADPDTIINIAAFCKRAADSNLQLVTNDGSGTGTSTDLGANYPASDTTSMYYGRIELRGGATRTAYYYVKNLVTGNSTSGSTTTTLPDAGVAMTYLDYVGNGPTTASAATKPFTMARVQAYYSGLAP